MKKVNAVLLAAFLSLLTIGMFVLAALFMTKQNNILEAIACILFPIFAQQAWKSWQDVSDITDWQSSLRGYFRGGIIKKEDYLRVSFAYLFRIVIDGDYFLVLNNRGTNKFQPVGGAYKCSEDEKHYLTKKFKVVTDDCIPIDETSKNDYRMKVQAKYMKKFFTRFDSTKDRERIDNLSREFKEEVVTKLGLDIKTIKYWYCGRDITHIGFSRYFQCFEILLADIVELRLDDESYQLFRELKESSSSYYFFATPSEIERCGVQPGTDKFLAAISDHTFKILESHAPKLQQIHTNKTDYLVNL